MPANLVEIMQKQRSLNVHHLDANNNVLASAGERPNTHGLGA